MSGSVSSSGPLEETDKGLNLDEQDAGQLELNPQGGKEGQSEVQTVGTVEEPAAGLTPGNVAGAWKWAFRNRVWDALEDKNIACMPRPVHHRIPNFVGADVAADRLAQLQEFNEAKCVKVNPDSPQKTVRFHTLNTGKLLLMPQPKLQTGFFCSLQKSEFLSGCLREAATMRGVVKYGKPLGLDAKVKVDLIVIGSVAVNPTTGARLGKGEGFAELEYGMLRWMGAVTEKTLVVTTIHDEQIVEDLPSEKFLEHDVPADLIVTPTRTIWTKPTRQKPAGILWHMLSPEKLARMKVVQELKVRIEREEGIELTLGPSEALPPVKRTNRADGSWSRKKGSKRWKR